MGVYLKMFNLFESTCYKFEVKFATILAHQLQNIDSDFGDYVSLLMRKQTVQEQRQTLELQKNDIEQQMNWDVIQNRAID